MHPYLRGTQADCVRRFAAPRPPLYGGLPLSQNGEADDSCVPAPSLCTSKLAAAVEQVGVEAVAASDSSDGGTSESEAAEGGGALVKGAWSAEEDALLLQYVQQHGSKNWGSILTKMPGFKRCGKSSRLRWVNHLRGGLKKTALSAEEEQRVMRLHAIHGNKWAKIAAELPGRTDNEVKNFWNGRQKRLLRTKQRAAMPEAPRDVRPQRHPPSPAPPSWLTSQDSPACHLTRARVPLFLVQAQQGATLRSGAPPDSPSSSSAHSVLSVDSLQAGLHKAPWRRFYVPPLVIPEVEPGEDGPGEPAQVPGPVPCWLPPRDLSTSLYPHYAHSQVPHPLNRTLLRDATGHPGHRGRLSLGRPVPALSPPPRPPLVQSPSPNMDSFLVSPSGWGWEAQARQERLPASGRRSRTDSQPTDSTDVAGTHPWMAPSLGGQQGRAFDHWGPREKRRRLEESEGESEVSFDAPETDAFGPLSGSFHFSPCLLTEPGASLGSSSWPAWLDEASPGHRLEAEAAAASLYPTATAFLAAFHPDWAAPHSQPNPPDSPPPLISLEELDEESPHARLKRIASCSNFMRSAAGL